MFKTSEIDLSWNLVGKYFLLEPLAAADFAWGFNLVHVRQLNVDHAQSLAVLAGALRVEAEQRTGTLLTLANVFRTSSRIPVYVAGFDRLEMPTGD